jgi:hypothetical protein
MDKWWSLFKDFGLCAQLKELRLLKGHPAYEVLLAWALVMFVQGHRAALCWWLVIHAASVHR